MMRRLSFGQLFLAVLSGFAGGIYIYKPMFQQYVFESKTLESDIPGTDTVKTENE